MSERAAILARLRAAADAHRAPDADPEDRVARRLIDHPLGPVPRQAQAAGHGRLTQFLNRLEQAAATVGRVSDRSELPRAIARELRKRNLPPMLRFGADPLFRDLDWLTLDATEGPGRLHEPATLSRAQFGLAETGTLVLLSGPDNPVTLTFLGETHFVVLRRSDLLAGFEAFWERFRAEKRDPRTVNFVTGPSRSAGIGQIPQLGALGPSALHLFLLG